LQLEIRVADPGLDAEQLDEATSGLYRQLCELDLDSVERPSRGPAPEGARGDALEIATLLVTVADSRVVASVVEVLRRWLGVRPAGRIRLRLGDDEIEVEGLSTAEQQRLIREWLDRRGHE
jgi:hypothetical protein